MLLDSKLTFVPHLEDLISKISKSIFLLRVMMKTTPPGTGKTIYYSLIYCHLVYGIELWGSASKTNLDRMEAIRCLAGLDFSQSCRGAFVTQGILTVPCIYIYRLLVRTFGCIEKFF